MLVLTKMKRAYIIDHIMPSDLDKKNIKNGLVMKEKMINEITDEYVKKLIPNWMEIERDYRKRHIDQYMEKVNCGEIDLQNLPKPDAVQCDTWIRWKDFDRSKYESDPNYGLRDYDYPIGEDVDVYPRNGYSEWIKENENHEFKFKDKFDTIYQMQIVIYGDNHDRYFPFQDYYFTNGWYNVTQNIDVFDFEAGIEDADKKPTPFYKLFFRNKKGYADNITYNGWFWEDVEWFKKNYPRLVVDGKVNATTILCDPFRVKMKDGHLNDIAVLNGRQWIKTKYITEMVNYCPFELQINNLILESESESEEEDW